jgi:chromatin segregation and condensation protein Rec8/ScpA/Scc1 (kleisin family)
MDELNEGEQEEQQCKLRTTQMHRSIERLFRSVGDFDEDSTVLFSKVASPSRSSRKQAAAQFCALLALKKLMVVDVEQNTPFADIVIRRGPKFDSNTS